MSKKESWEFDGINPDNGKKLKLEGDAWCKVGRTNGWIMPKRIKDCSLFKPGPINKLRNIFKLFPRKLDDYYELFLGDGHVLFELLNRLESGNIILAGQIYVNDTDRNLINLCMKIKHDIDIFIDQLEHLKKLFRKHGDNKMIFYESLYKKIDGDGINAEAYYILTSIDDWKTCEFDIPECSLRQLSHVLSKYDVHFQSVNYNKIIVDSDKAFVYVSIPSAFRINRLNRYIMALDCKYLILSPKTHNIVSVFVNHRIFGLPGTKKKQALILITSDRK